MKLRKQLDLEESGLLGIEAKMFVYNVLCLGTIPSFLNLRRMESPNLLILFFFNDTFSLMLAWTVAAPAAGFLRYTLL